MGIYIILHTFQILQNLLKEEISIANGPLVEPYTLSLAMADHKPLETSGWGHWFMLIILLLFLFSFIVKIVLRVKARTNNLPWVKSVGSFWFLAYYL